MKIFSVLSVFWILCHNCRFGSFQKTAGLFDLKLDRINDVYHRAAVMTLLKARGKSLLKAPHVTLPDRVVFEQCSKSAKSSVALAKCVVPLLDLQDSPAYSHQMDSLSPIEKIVEFFRNTKQYFDSYSPFPAPLQKIIPVNSQFPSTNTRSRMTNPIETSNPWNQPVPVKEFYQLRSVIPESQAEKQGYEFKPHPIKIRELKNTFDYRNPYVSGIKWRRKREAERRIEFSGLSNLEKVKNYYKMLHHVEKFMKKLNDENSQFINKASNVPFKFELKKDKNMTVIENVFQALGSALGTSKSKFSFMSPRILSILPGTEKGRKHLLSPTLFSFHEKDGLLPLPNILKSLNINGETEKQWLEMLLTVSGASKTLDDIVKKMEPEMKEMNEKIYPSILDLEMIEEKWNHVRESYSEEQRKNIDEDGYAFLEPEQIQLLYSNQYGRRLKLDLEKYSTLTKDEKQKRIDEDIRKLAKLSESKILQEERRRRRRRQIVHENGEITTDQAGGHHDYSQEAEGHHGPIHMVTLEPWAFGSRVGSGAALEAVTLSPYAFFSEILMPEALILQTLGPRAFVPSILSPSALIGRILSPAAFRAEVLSPRALTLFLLTPEALLAEVLSPKMLEARILSPEALIIQVLSPSLIVPRVLSPEVGALLILSPSVLSPRILSGESLTVEVLSPHILGGGHSSHEDEEQGKDHDHMEDEHKELEDILNPGHKNEHGNNHEHGNDHGHEHGNDNEHGNGHVHDSNQENAVHQEHGNEENHINFNNNQNHGFNQGFSQGFHEEPNQGFEVEHPRNPWGEIHNEGFQSSFGEAQIEEQRLNLGEGEVKEVNLGQIQIQDNNLNEIHDNSIFF